MDAIVHPATLETSVAFPAPTVITGSGGITLPKMSFSGQGTVQNPPRGLAERSVGQILALVLVALGTAGLLCVPGPDQGTVGYDLTVLGIALAIAWRICDKRK